MAKGEKVYVGLSGGVDSAVAAALLLHAGYDVTGVFIKIWQPSFIECAWKEDRLDAMRVAAFLKIPFKTLDLSNEYEREVITRMKEDYASGITPNPDVLCNRFIKFGAFREWAIEEGADYIATGHHARLRRISAGHTGFELLRGADAGKDQSYFLHQLTQDDLARALFPVGHMQKADVRSEAARLGLPVAKRPDSQGLCFVGAVDMHDFLKELIHPKEGGVLNAEGERIGRHDGAGLYTVGQRHKFSITDPEAAKVPQYVVKTDVATNTITVSPDKEAAFSSEVTIVAPNWIGDVSLDEREYQGEVRYHHKPISCRIRQGDNGQYIVVFDEEVLAAPGQSLVLYSGEVCIGGGTIL